MSTLEMIIWGVLYALISITVAGIGFMMLGRQATCAESERLLSEADEDDYAASEWF